MKKKSTRFELSKEIIQRKRKIKKTYRELINKGLDEFEKEKNEAKS